MTFKDRDDAGRQLAEKLSWLAGDEDILVLALPRGGVPVGKAVAEALGAALDVFVVRKLGTPGQAELAMGAVASGGVRVLNERIVEALGLDPQRIADITEREREKLQRQEQQFRGDRSMPRIAGKTVILVDDGLATGATMHAACDAVRRLEPRQIVVAVPTAPPDAVERLKQTADHVIAVMTPSDFAGVGAWYQDFSQVSDGEVRRMMEAD
jgi:predicted phosphoribosyltransferase